MTDPRVHVFSPKIDRVWESAGEVGRQIRTEADQAYQELVNHLTGQALSAAEQDDFRWAIHTLTRIGYESLTADAAALQRLEQQRKDAVSVLMDILACQSRATEHLAMKRIANIFQRAADLVCRSILVG